MSPVSPTSTQVTWQLPSWTWKFYMSHHWAKPIVCWMVQIYCVSQGAILQWKEPSFPLDKSLESGKVPSTTRPCLSQQNRLTGSSPLCISRIPLLFASFGFWYVTQRERCSDVWFKCHTRIWGDQSLNSCWMTLSQSPEALSCHGSPLGRKSGL